MLGIFPNDRRDSSYYVRQFKFQKFDGEWQDTLRWVDAYNAEPYTYCTHRTK